MRTFFGSGFIDQRLRGGIQRCAVMNKDHTFQGFGKFPKGLMPDICENNHGNNKRYPTWKVLGWLPPFHISLTQYKLWGYWSWTLVTLTGPEWVWVPSLFDCVQQGLVASSAGRLDFGQGSWSKKAIFRVDKCLSHCRIQLLCPFHFQGLASNVLSGELLSFSDEIPAFLTGEGTCFCWKGMIFAAKPQQ